MHPKDADGMADSVDPDQTAPSGSTLFAQTCLSENCRSLLCMANEYMLIVKILNILLQSWSRRFWQGYVWPWFMSGTLATVINVFVYFPLGLATRILDLWGPWRSL